MVDCCFVGKEKDSRLVQCPEEVGHDLQLVELLARMFEHVDWLADNLHHNFSDLSGQSGDVWYDDRHDYWSSDFPFEMWIWIDCRLLNCFVVRHILELLVLPPPERRKCAAIKFYVCLGAPFLTTEYVTTCLCVHFSLALHCSHVSKTIYGWMYIMQSLRLGLLCSLQTFLMVYFSQRWAICLSFAAMG